MSTEDCEIYDRLKLWGYWWKAGPDDDIMYALTQMSDLPPATRLTLLELQALKS